MPVEEALPEADDVGYFVRAQAEDWGHMLRVVARFAGITPGSRVLDVGTGPGLLVRLCAQAGASLAVGCDRSYAMVATARTLASGPGEGNFACASLPCLPFASANFDLVLATNVLFLLAGLAGRADALADMVRLLKPGGRLVVLNPGELLTRRRAERFADERGLTGFGRMSFVNYGRLAEQAGSVTQEEWLAMARFAGLTDLRSEVRVEGLIRLISGRKPW